VLTGRPPFGDASAEQVLAQQLGDRLRERLQLDAFPNPLEEFLQRGLAPNADERFADASELRQAWRQVVRQMRRSDDPRPWWRRVFEGPIDDDSPFDDPVLMSDGRTTS
jgi:eukaryotic-like serine/threonine-protein kinase